MTTEQQDIGQNLSQLALSGFGWQLLNRVGRQGIQLLISVVLARLLLPSDYGLVGMVAIFVTLTQTASDFGFTGAIVQKKDVSDEQYQTVFWLNNFASLGLWGLSWLISPLIARFYHEPALASIFIVSTLGMVFMAPSGVSRSLIYKQMQFRASFLTDWAGMLSGGLVSVLLAFMGIGVWSLVFGNLVTALVITVTVWHFCPWRPRLVWKPGSLMAMTKFSSHYLGNRILQSLTGNLDYVVIGKFFTATQLGLYFLAFRLMELPRAQLGLVIQSVMYPVFIHLQENDERTREVLYKLGLTISLLVFPTMTGLFVVAPDLITLVYGKNWAEAAVFLRLLVWSGMISAVDHFAFVMTARGKADWVFWSSFGRTGSFLTFVLIGAIFGLKYVAAFVSIHAVLMTLFFQHWVNRFTGFTYTLYFRSLAPAAFASTLLFLSVWGLKSILNPLSWNLWIMLGLQITVGAIAFVLSLIAWPLDDIRQTILWLQLRVPRLMHSAMLAKWLQYWGDLRYRFSNNI